MVQQPEVRIYSLQETAVSEGICLNVRTSFSEKLRLIFKLSSYILIWKTEDNLIFLFASTPMKPDLYINQAMFPTDQMARKTPRSYGETGVFMNIGRSEMLTIQTISQK